MVSKRVVVIHYSETNKAPIGEHRRCIQTVHHKQVGHQISTQQTLRFLTKSL